MLAGKLNFSGVIRNDAFVTGYQDKAKFSDILETRLVLNKKAEKWKFYADGRAYVYNGYITEHTGNYKVKLMRSFIRYYPELGDFTLGKTYINFGNPGIFNPFELDKSLNFSDLTYTKEGMLAFEIEIPLGELSGIKTFIGYDNFDANYTTGLALFSNAFKFDFGLVYLRKGANRKSPEPVSVISYNVFGTGRNLVGIYFKGDLGLGISGAYCYHIHDRKDKDFSEAQFGLDYSFFRGKLQINALFYYNQNGGDGPDVYQLTNDTYFSAKYYVYGTVNFVFDEFFSAQTGCFANLNDGSLILIPSIKLVITNGLTFILQGAVATGKGKDEFTRDVLGKYTILSRVEAKF